MSKPARGPPRGKVGQVKTKRKTPPHTRVDCWCLRPQWRTPFSAHRTALKAQPKPEKPPKAVEVLRDVILSHIGHFPRSAQAIFGAVRDDYGEAGERRLWRNLSILVKAGLVVKHPKQDVEDTDGISYLGHVYSRSKEASTLGYVLPQRQAAAPR